MIDVDADVDTDAKKSLIYLEQYGVKTRYVVTDASEIDDQVCSVRKSPENNNHLS